MSKLSPLFEGQMRGTATFCGAYRYNLRREWNPEAGRAVFVMLNPSVADADVLDNTVRRCLNWTRDWGLGSLEVVNLFALVSTAPAALLKHSEPIGPQNDQHILEAVLSPQVKRVICAWGGWGYVQQRGARVRAMLAENRVESYCFGLTQGLEPKHPLYVRGDTELARFI